MNGVAVDDTVLLQNRKIHQICSMLVSKRSARSNYEDVTRDANGKAQWSTRRDTVRKIQLLLE